jgi:23S rRNA (adenine2503-C2)-methyltransferase
MRDTLFGKTKQELEAIVTERGLPRYTADQLCDWLYKKHARSFDEMTNLSKRARATLADEFDIDVGGPVEERVASDATKKYLFEVSLPPRAAGAPPIEKHVESAYIPEPTRHTLCLSTQVGCKMGCLFCMTARQGFQGHLTAGDVLNQYRSLPERDDITNIVYMGMGEPLDNIEAVLRSLEVFTSDWGYGLSPSRITVSTIGVVPAMKRLLAESSCHLAVSLHSPFEEERRRLMPIENVYSLTQVLQTIRDADLPKRRRVSFEYIVFGGVNHSTKHVKELARLVGDLRCRINLLYFHSIPDAPLEPATEEQMLAFQRELKGKGLRTTIRRSRGQDIEAACGMLSTKSLDVRRQEAAALDY